MNFSLAHCTPHRPDTAENTIDGIAHLVPGAEAEIDIEENQKEIEADRDEEREAIVVTAEVVGTHFFNFSAVRRAVVVQDRVAGNETLKCFYIS